MFITDFFYCKFIQQRLEREREREKKRETCNSHTHKMLIFHSFIRSPSRRQQQQRRRRL